MDTYAILAAGMGPARLLAAFPDDARAIVAATTAALELDVAGRGELAEGELRPLEGLPGWYAYRPPATVFDNGNRVDDFLLMRAELVKRQLGYTPDARTMLPG